MISFMLSPLLLLFFLLPLLSVVVNGESYFLLINKAPKCFQVNAPPFVKLLIKYNAPDLISVQEDGRVEAGGQVLNTDGNGGADIDAKFNERFQKRIDILKRANLKDVHISITPRDSSGSVIVDRSKGDIPSSYIPEKRREALEKQQGVMEYETRQLPHDGSSIEFCIQSYTASSETPSRVSLAVDIESPRVAAERQLREERTELGKSLKEESKLIKEETSRITAELVRMHRRSRSIAGDARYSMDRETSFRSQSIALNQAVKYWPMFRMAILLIAGYIQVTSVVGFMRKKHIC